MKVWKEKVDNKTIFIYHYKKKEEKSNIGTKLDKYSNKSFKA